MFAILTSANGIQNVSNSAQSVTFLPSMIKGPGGGGGGPSVSWASMEFNIINKTPWYSFWYIVDSDEISYFNVTNYYWGATIASPPSVSLTAYVLWFPGGTVLNKNGPYSFVNGTNSNGIQYEIFSADVEMVNYAIIYGENGPVNNMYTNILVNYEVMGNGNIYIKYWVSYNNVVNSEVAAWMAITNLAKEFAQSGGG